MLVNHTMSTICCQQSHRGELNPESFRSNRFCRPVPPPGITYDTSSSGHTGTLATRAGKAIEAQLQRKPRDSNPDAPLRGLPPFQGGAVRPTRLRLPCSCRAESRGVDPPGLEGPYPLSRRGASSRWHTFQEAHVKCRSPNPRGVQVSARPAP